MVTIAISELKKFLGHAKNIKDNGILPILSYVKLECKGKKATLTKTNLSVFVVVDVEAEFKKPCTILIHEHTLSAKAEFSKGQELKITMKDKNVILDDGFRPVKVQTNNDPFPAIENETEQNKASFDIGVLEALSIAKNHSLISNDKSIRVWMSFVHIKKIGKKNYVFGANGEVSFFKSFKDKLPEMNLDPETVTIISRFKSLEYSSNGKYDYFQGLGIRYGFIKSETKCPDLETILEKFKSEDYFIVNRNDLVNFCGEVNAINSSSLPPEITIENANKEEIVIKYSDISGETSSEEKLLTDEKTFEPDKIIIQPKNLLIVLSGLSSEKIKVSKIPGNMIISTDEEKDYMGSVSELAKL